jgi:hypothetical protein
MGCGIYFGNGPGLSQATIEALIAAEIAALGLGSMATQNADAVAVTGGDLDGVSIGVGAPALRGVFSRNVDVNPTVTVSNGFAGGFGLEANGPKAIRIGPDASSRIEWSVGGSWIAGGATGETVCGGQLQAAGASFSASVLLPNATSAATGLVLGGDFAWFRSAAGVGSTNGMIDSHYRGKVVTGADVVLTAVQSGAFVLATSSVTLPSNPAVGTHYYMMNGIPIVSGEGMVGWENTGASATAIYDPVEDYPVIGLVYDGTMWRTMFYLGTWQSI